MGSMYPQAIQRPCKAWMDDMFISLVEENDVEIDGGFFACVWQVLSILHSCSRLAVISSTCLPEHT